MTDLHMEVLNALEIVIKPLEGLEDGNVSGEVKKDNLDYSYELVDYNSDFLWL